jgi:hypothetical protein
MIDWSRIPSELRERAQWCVSPGLDDDKAPRSINGHLAKSTDPSTWSSFDAACRAASDRGWHVGYMLHESDPFACIDLDVKDSTPDAHIQRHQRIITEADSYTELSRSGRGWHVFVTGAIGKGRRRDGVEVYSQERFIICTGNVVQDQPIAERQALLTSMVAQMAPAAPPEVELSGDNCPDFGAAAHAAEDTGELGRLFRGDWEERYGSGSEADLALVKLLIPRTLSPLECWQTFRLSKLGRRVKDGKVKADRPDYARSTMALALQHLANDAAAAAHGQAMADGLFWSGPAPHDERHFRLLLDGDLERQPPLHWLVKRVIPDAGIGAIYGDSGTFKSFLTLDLLAHIANGQEWFDYRVKQVPAVYVPFEGQGGVPSRVKAWRLAQAMKQDPDVLMSVVPPDDVRTNIAVILDPINLREKEDRDTLVATLTEQGWAGGVLCIDTLAHASAGLDENSSAMAEMISIFRDLQLRLGGVILLVHHSGKDASRGMRGWSGLHAAMDFVIECQRDKENAALTAEFVLTKVKDGTSGTRTKFLLQTVQIGIDEDGDYMSSLVVAVPEQVEGRADSDNPFKDVEAEANDDDAFVDAWIREEVTAGKRPTGRWLDANRVHVAGRRNLTQKRLRDAIDRMKGVGRLVVTEGGPSGAKWLRPVDVLTGGAG